MTNGEMKAGRFLRWARARKAYAWIVAHVEAGRTVYLTTALKSTKIGKRQLPQVRASKAGLLVQHGSRWLDYSGVKITAA